MKTPALAALVLLLAAPTASSAWSVKGAFEPDTARDVTDVWMHLEPDRSAHARALYFNGFGAPGFLLTHTFNPNVATVESSVLPTPFVPIAMFGLWKDCNADGYVGAFDQGALEYPAALLLDDAICPSATPPPGRAWSSHNDGEWVVEYMPIGYDDVTSAGDSNPLTINDTKSRVWADWGLPGDAPLSSCALFPAPRGALRSTGAVLRWVDCYTGHRVVPAASDAFDAAGLAQLSFNDAPADRPDLSGSQLNVANPWGDEADPPIATAFDCAASDQIEILDPTGGSLRNLATIPVPGGPTIYVNGTDSQGRIANLTVPALAPDVPEGGSPAGTVNETEAALTDCDRTNSGEIVDIDGEPAGSDAGLPYAIEGNEDPLSPDAPRTRTDHVLAFVEGARGGGPLVALLGERTRDDAGLGSASVAGFWIGIAASVGGPSPYVGRDELAPSPVTHITYYAYASPLLVESEGFRTPQGTGSYGAEGCGATPATVECDETRWWRNEAGEDITPRDPALGEDPAQPGEPEQGEHTKIGVRVGQPYFFRDVDCIDTSVGAARELGVHWGALTATDCARP